jgi:hypothetical protein
MSSTVELCSNDAKAALIAAVRLHDYGAVARILSASIVPDPEPAPILIIDRHEMVDQGEGPEFFCPDLPPDEMTLIELERRAELRLQEGVAEILAWMNAGPAAIPPRHEPEPYGPAASTASAFWYLVSLKDPDKLAAWLRDRERDAPLLLKLLEAK